MHVCPSHSIGLNQGHILWGGEALILLIQGKRWKIMSRAYVSRIERQQFKS